MKITLSVIKADIGSIGGHLAPSQKLLEAVREHVEREGSFLIDSYVGHTGDDIAILMTHTLGVRNERVGVRRAVGPGGRWRLYGEGTSGVSI